MYETHRHPLRNQRRLTRHNPAQQQAHAVRLSGKIRIMTRDRIVREQLQGRHIAATGEILEGAHTNMTGGQPDENRAGLRRVAQNPLTGEDHAQRTRRGDPKRMKGLAEEVFAQDGTQRGSPVAAA